MPDDRKERGSGVTGVHDGGGVWGGCHWGGVWGYFFNFQV